MRVTSPPTRITSNSRTRRVELWKCRTYKTPPRSGRRSVTPGPRRWCSTTSRSSRPSRTRPREPTNSWRRGDLMTSVRGATPGATIEGDQEVEKERWLGRQPIGLLFILPYVIFLVGIFVYPLVVQFVISFYDFFFAAPGATVDRPWVGLQNYVDVLQDPTFQRSLFNVFIFMIINVPATVFF